MLPPICAYATLESTRTAEPMRARGMPKPISLCIRASLRSVYQVRISRRHKRGNGKKLIYLARRVSSNPMRLPKVKHPGGRFLPVTVQCQMQICYLLLVSFFAHSSQHEDAGPPLRPMSGWRHDKNCRRTGICNTLWADATHGPIARSRHRSALGASPTWPRLRTGKRLVRTGRFVS